LGHCHALAAFPGRSKALSHEVIIELLGVAITVGTVLWSAHLRVVRRIESRQKTILECEKWKLEQMNAPDHIIGLVTKEIQNGK
jgi:hypothetical protein